MDNDLLYADGFNSWLRSACLFVARNTFLASLLGDHYPRTGKRHDLAENGKNVVFQLQMEKELRRRW